LVKPNEIIVTVLVQ